jgi:hypothetical protein
MAASTEDSMSSDDQTVGQQQPPERPETNDAIDAERDAATDPLAGIETAPGDRLTDSVELLRIEASLACEDGTQLDNPAKPRTEAVGERFFENVIQDSELVPAWTRPWEVDE